MRTRTTFDRPARLGAIRRRFECWRATRTGLSRIPAHLWAAAVKAVGRYGLSPTAQALGLDYNTLKRRVAAAGGEQASGSGPEGQAVATFVELAPPVSSGVTECIVELENAGEAKMRIHLKGVAAPDLAALSRSFWGPQA